MLFFWEMESSLYQRLYIQCFVYILYPISGCNPLFTFLAELVYWQFVGDRDSRYLLARELELYETCNVNLPGPDFLVPVRLFSAFVKKNRLI